MLDLAAVAVMVIFFYRKFCVKKIVYILKRNALHVQSHTGLVVTLPGNRSIRKLWKLEVLYIFDTAHTSLGILHVLISEILHVLVSKILHVLV